VDPLAAKQLHEDDRLLAADGAAVAQDVVGKDRHLQILPDVAAKRRQPILPPADEGQAVEEALAQEPVGAAGDPFLPGAALAGDVGGEHGHRGVDAADSAEVRPPVLPDDRGHRPRLGGR
jgi:hypothetical protein